MLSQSSRYSPSEYSHYTCNWLLPGCHVFELTGDGGVELLGMILRFLFVHKDSLYSDLIGDHLG